VKEEEEEVGGKEDEERGGAEAEEINEGTLCASIVTVAVPAISGLVGREEIEEEDEREEEAPLINECGTGEDEAALAAYMVEGGER